MPCPLILDCDPGVDDAIALLLALASPELGILGITTVAGNVPLSLTQRNARQICELAGSLSIPIYAGCARPLVRPLCTADDVHGKTGLAGLVLPDPGVSLQSQHAVDFIIDTLLGSPAPVTLAATGPLTNIALALIKEPRITPQIERLVLMAGSAGPGNITAAAEFNAYVDPHAAHVVFTAGIPSIVMFGLNLTHQVLTTPARRERIRDLGSPVAQAAAMLLDQYGSHDSERFQLSGGPLHDPCVIGYLLQPDLFGLDPAHVSVEIGSELTMGQTVVDLRVDRPQPANAQVAMGVDADGFYDLLTERLSRYPLQLKS